MNQAVRNDTKDVPRAIVITLISLFIFGLQDIAVKAPVADYPPTQLVMIRF
ncbi:hypothetical protein PsW64_03189 [Pseudovibrio sp. W64]|nr:hypothetical protein PsW64_03189 [Pseudovibrio sp. W64]